MCGIVQRSRKLTLVCLVEVNYEALSGGVSLSKLPELLDGAIVNIAPNGLDPQSYYLVSDDVSDLRHGINQLAVPYHQYVVEELGERCALADCAEHRDLAQVVPLFRLK